MSKNKKIWLNYDIKSYPGDPNKAKLIKFTNNPEYDFEITFQIVKKGIFNFIKLEVDKEKTPSAREGSLNIEDVLYSYPITLSRILRTIIAQDLKYSINYAINKSCKEKKVQPKSFKIKKELINRIKNKTFAIVHNLSKLNENWNEIFSRESKLISGIISMGYNSYFNDISQTLVNKEAERISDILQENHVIKDLKTLCCFRNYVESVFFNSGKLIGQNEDKKRNKFFSKLISNNWESILDASSKSKKKIISNWPNIKIGIENIPVTDFNRNVKNKLEIKSHLSYFGQYSKNNITHTNNIESMPVVINEKIKKIVMKSSADEIKRAYKCFRLHRRLVGMISYSRLNEMYSHLFDSIKIYLGLNCHIEVFEEFEKGILNAKSLKRVIELCNIIHRDNVIYSMENNGYNENKNWTWPIINPNFNKDKAVVTFLENSEDLYIEGQKMKHCVGSYIDDVVNGLCYVFHISYKGEDATASIIRNEKVGEFRFQQCYGPLNCKNKASIKGEELIKEWLEKLNNTLYKDNKKKITKKIIDDDNCFQENEINNEYCLDENYAF